MIAEKAADLIMGNTPLAPIHAEFYRHKKAEPALQSAVSSQQSAVSDSC
jgi:hypothetical protein